MYSSTHRKYFTIEVPNHSESPTQITLSLETKLLSVLKPNHSQSANQITLSLQSKSLLVTMASRNKNVLAVVYYDAYVAVCDESVEFKGGNNILVSIRRGMTFNV